VRPDGTGRTGDDGITLIEILVTLTLMSIVMALATTGLLEIYKGTNRTENTANSQAQLNLAFLRLDKELRYAAGISTPDLVNGDRYVEYLITNTGTPRCSELRLVAASGEFQTRAWTQGMNPLAPEAWHSLASGVSGTTPFTFVAADATFNFQRLRLNITVATGTGDAVTTKQTDVTFTALNTTLATSSATLCTEGRTIP
jgi:prepilin-type N-terminal cleavage/methylation domain-containing protein